MAVRALAIVLLLAGIAGAQPPPAPATQPTTTILHDANEAAVAGNWAAVDALVAPLLRGEGVALADVGEAHRLAGLAAFFQHRTADAEAHFLAYLRIDADARLDPALVPPDAVTFFEDVRTRHAAELRARRPRARPSLVLELLPPFGQWQNGEHGKAWIVGGTLAAFAITSVTTYAVLRTWCSSSDKTCGTHAHAASTLRVVNLASGAGLLLTYLYGVYDGVVAYRRFSATPFAAPTSDGAVVGLVGRF